MSLNFFVLLRHDETFITANIPDHCLLNKFASVNLLLTFIEYILLILQN